MTLQLDGLERHGELQFGAERYSPEVQQELLAMTLRHQPKHGNLTAGLHPEEIRNIVLSHRPTHPAIPRSPSGHRIEGDLAFLDPRGPRRGGVSDQLTE